MPVIALLIGLGIFYLYRKNTGTTPQLVSNSPINTNAGPIQDTQVTVPPNSVPPQANYGANITVPTWYQPKDDLTVQGIVQAQQLTIRQIQTAFNMLSANLAVTGKWDLPTQQATWDFQYIHQNDNPLNKLNVTSEVDLATQNAIQSALTASPAGKAANVKTVTQAFFG